MTIETAFWLMIMSDNNVIEVAHAHMPRRIRISRIWRLTLWCKDSF